MGKNVLLQLATLLSVVSRAVEPSRGAHVDLVESFFYICQICHIISINWKDVHYRTYRIDWLRHCCIVMQESSTSSVNHAGSNGFSKELARTWPIAG